MSKENILCGFCGKEITSDQDSGWLKFPYGSSKPVHFSHVGVKEEYERQNEKCL